MIEKKLKLYVETYGCQMNVADSEVVVAILQLHNYNLISSPENADLILVNTCSIRQNAEQRVRGRLENFRSYKKKNKNLVIGVIGCMAERLKEKFLEEEPVIDMIVGPDAYRDLPALIKAAESGHKAVNTLLSTEETYGDISPVRLDRNSVSAFISIMRGCNNHCAYCVVPFTRGRERSRDPESILREAREVFEKGFREVTLLGQNVNSYHWLVPGDNIEVDFADLLEKTASIYPRLRIRFSTSHPKDLSDKVLHVIASYPNICKSIHLPLQSGSTRVLERMNRRYTRESYFARIKAIRTIVPEASVSTDIITGFCGETEEDHLETLSLMKEAAFDFAFMFKYSERPGTLAAKKYKDDVPEEVKARRLSEIIKLQNNLSLESKKGDLGKTFEVLIEGTSKKSEMFLMGRTSQNKVAVFPAGNHKPGDYLDVRVIKVSSATLIAESMI
jgi:tRNA-2-methylthio-N6-dimethylallyladenosine synthase